VITFIQEEGADGATTRPVAPADQGDPQARARGGVNALILEFGR
jgi:hypothetical protein